MDRIHPQDEITSVEADQAERSMDRAPRDGVQFFQDALAFIALVFVGLLFVVGTAIVILSLDRVPS